MNNIRLEILFVKTPQILLLVFLTGACVSTEVSNFYSLSTIGKSETSSNKPRNISLKVGPVVVPDSLNRPQIVTKIGENQKKVSEFHRWVGSLSDDIQRVLSENLSILVPTNQVIYNQEMEIFESDYQVVVNIREFGGELGSRVTLNASWTVVSKNRSVKPISRKTIISQRLKSDSYDDYVQLLSHSLMELSREIVSELK